MCNVYMTSTAWLYGYTFITMEKIFSGYSLIFPEFKSIKFGRDISF